MIKTFEVHVMVDPDEPAPNQIPDVSGTDISKLLLGAGILVVQVKERAKM